MVRVWGNRYYYAVLVEENIDIKHEDVHSSLPKKGTSKTLLQTKQNKTKQNKIQVYEALCSRMLVEMVSVIVKNEPTGMPICKDG